MTAAVNSEGQLPLAVRELRHALHGLVDPVTRMQFTGKPLTAPSLYLQLWDAVRGEQSQTGGGGGGKSRPPFWTDAFVLLQDIDTAAEAWQPAYTGVPPTVGRLRTLVDEGKTGNGWRPQDVHGITQITSSLRHWAKRITELLDPESVKYVSAPCPSCEATHVYRKDSAGETVRQPALQLVAGKGCTCLKCHAHWTPDLYLHLVRVLGFDMPEGILE